MKKTLLTLNHSLLFLCVSMYLGTGWSMWLFSFPSAPHLTPDTYYYAFVPQVAAATAFFTGMTKLMIALGLIMTVSEWKTAYRLVPIVVLLSVAVATAMTLKYIFPLNDAMTAGIKDPIQLQQILAHWMFLNKIRVALWTVQWAAMILYFGGKLRTGASI